ncbi:MAG: hypothetical protein P4L42_08890 [Desulfocapsaceae bacterium]|nr:hypothetical protein [Desulfocapsaceae bacterium]
MFVQFYYSLKEAGIPVSPTSFLTLHKAMHSGLVRSLDDLYIAARATLVKTERHFDLYDRIFAALFAGAGLPEGDDIENEFLARGMLEDWLQNPKVLAASLGLDEKILQKMSPSELLDYFKQRLRDQDGRHDGGSRWIGTGGTSPVGHSGFHPGGMRVGGLSRNSSAVKVAGERRYKAYSADGPLTLSSMGEALKRLRHLVPEGVKDRINVDASIYQTIRNGGEIEIVFDRGIADRLKIILAIDNGGWSMDPYVDVVQILFRYAQAQFKDLKTYFFHNTIYDLLWEDPNRYRKPVRIDDFSRLDPDTRLIIVGDASMAPYELMSTDGAIYAFERSGRPSIERLRFLTDVFRHTIWMNPIPQRSWSGTHTIEVIRSLIPMFELSLDGLEKAVRHLMQK